MQKSFSRSWKYLLSHLFCLPDILKEPLFSWEMQSGFSVFIQPASTICGVLCVCFFFLIIIIIGYGK